MGESYPHPDRFTIGIWDDNHQKFSGKPEAIYLDLEIYATGLIKEDDRAVEMVLTGPDQITIP
jgi:hypothetical protein